MLLGLFLSLAVLVALTRCAIAYADFDPQVGVDAEGDATFVWKTETGQIQTRTRAFNGSLTPIQTLSPGPVQGVPRIAVNADGDATFAWINAANDRLTTRTQTAEGSLGPTQGISGLTVARRQQVAIDPDGNATFVWERFNGSDYRVKTRLRMADGTLIPRQNLSLPGPADLEPLAPQVAVDETGGATFVWQQLRASGKRRVITRTRTAGGVLTPHQDLGNGGPLPLGAQPQVAVGTSGPDRFVWIDGHGRSVLNGSRALSGKGSSRPQVAVAADGSASVIVAGPATKIKAYRCSVSLSCVGTDLAIGGAAPELAVSPDNNATFVWRHESGGGETTIQTRRRVKPELTQRSGYSKVSDVSAPPGTPRGAPQVAVDPSDNAIFVWDNTDSVQVRARAADGTLSGIQNLTQP